MNEPRPSNNTINGARWLQAALPRFDAPDPKAGDYPHLSPYANRACNPLRYLDPSGEVIMVAHHHKLYKIEMSDGLFEGIDVDGIPYDNEDDENSFLNNAIEAISQIASGAFGAALVEYLIQSDQTITITESNSKNKYSSETKTVKWNDASQSGIVQKEDKSYSTSGAPFLSLSHELGHAADDVYGTLNESLWRKFDTEKAALSEKTALIIENFVRAENGYELRTYYAWSKNQDSSIHPIPGSSINDIPVRPIFAMYLFIRATVKMVMKQ